MVKSDLMHQTVLYFGRSSFMNENICKKSHRYIPEYEKLPEDQSNIGRHKCAACAYEKWFFDDLKGYPLFEDDSVLADLPVSQAGTVRHRDAFLAYKKGYERGSWEKNNPKI